MERTAFMESRWCVLVITIAFASSGESRPPQILHQSPKLVLFVANDTVVLRCKADGEPPPSYFWRKNGKVIDITHAGSIDGQGSLLLEQLKKDDAGEYQCFAKNQFGQAVSDKATLHLKEVRLDKRRASTLVVLRGRSIIIPCYAWSSFGKPNISWRYLYNNSISDVKMDQRLHVDTEGRLFFANVQPIDHNRGYFCVVKARELKYEEADNPTYIRVMGSDTQVSPHISFSQPKYNFGLVGENFTLVCIVAGNPTPSVTWEFKSDENIELPIESLPGVRISKAGTNVNINGLVARHEGIYRCIGSSIISSQKVYRELRLVLKKKPFWIQKPENADVSVGSNHTFICHAGGDPQVSIRWFIDGNPVRYINSPRKHFEGNLFVLSNLKLNDTAVVQCNASNSFGYVFANAYLNVVEEPENAGEIQRSLAVPVIHSFQVKLVCLCLKSFMERGPVTLSWTKNGARIDGRGLSRIREGGLYGALLINGVTVGDTGLYTCAVSTGCNKAQASAVLTVGPGPNAPHGTAVQCNRPLRSIAAVIAKHTWQRRRVDGNFQTRTCIVECFVKPIEGA